MTQYTVWLNNNKHARQVGRESTSLDEQLAIESSHCNGGRGRKEGMESNSITEVDGEM